MPWHGNAIDWAIPPRDDTGRRLEGPCELFTASFNPAELVMMRVARERGATRVDLEPIHMFKAELDAVIVDSEAAA